MIDVSNRGSIAANGMRGRWVERQLGTREREIHSTAGCHVTERAASVPKRKKMRVIFEKLTRGFLKSSLLPRLLDTSGAPSYLESHSLGIWCTSRVYDSASLNI